MKTYQRFGYKECAGCSREFRVSEIRSNLGFCTECLRIWKAQQVKKWRTKNGEHVIEYGRKYRKENQVKIYSRSVKQRAEKSQRSPKWADLTAIQLYYETRKALSEATGIEYHVDHELPLKGRLVSGLHVPENLQIIPALRNIRKNNAYTPG